MDIFNILCSVLILIVLELVLGIDNLVFLSILSEKLPVAQRPKARRVGLLLAMITRLIFLLAAVWLVKLTRPLFHWDAWAFSIRDIFMIFGGVFLLIKSTQEIHQDMNAIMSQDTNKKRHRYRVTFQGVVMQIAVMDIIFSFDSVLTAIGMTTEFSVMAVAIVISILMMMYASEPVAHFIEKYPSIKMLALSFLIMIGMILIADGFAYHIPRAYVYFSMGFSLSVEALNIIKQNRLSKLRK